MVYGFDETDRDPKNVIPDKKFVFSAEQFKAQYEKTELGPSYSIWLPWDDVGGIEKQISLIARFTSEKGEMVTSDQSKMLLPGMPPPKKELPQEFAGIPLLQSVKVPSVPPMPLQARPIPKYRNDAAIGAQQADYQEPVGAAGGMNLGGVTPSQFCRRGCSGRRPKCGPGSTHGNRHVRPAAAIAAAARQRGKCFAAAG